MEFYLPFLGGDELSLVNDAILQRTLSGDGQYTRKCQKSLEEDTGAERVLLTNSCTHALELSALLLQLEPGDEVIMPSFTFVSTANAFVLQKAIPVFVDIRPDTMNINEALIEEAITPRTRAIVVMHYAGVACEMDRIMAIAKKHKLFVVEDAAQCIGAYYKGQHLGTIGDLGSFSFHSTKNIQCGEGGALLVNNKKMINAAEIIREKGTNRSQFLQGEVDRYSWVSVGSSYLMSELNAAFLFAQIQWVERINKKRIELWQVYHRKLQALQEYIDLPPILDNCQHNAHTFFIKAKDFAERTILIDHLKTKNIGTAFHYVPLHSSKAGKYYGRFHGKDKFTTIESERLLRLPLYFDLEMKQVNEVVKHIFDFYEQ